jgi:flavin reductase (DIM6/NTAB) family NADH-FMN oxidoreductase RutF
MEYLNLSLQDAYTLLNGGGVVWVCTRSPKGRYDVTPVAWNCALDYEPVSRVLIVSDTGHAAFSNIQNQKEFALALPTYHQKELIVKTGSVSAWQVDKYTAFSIPFHTAKSVDVRIPDDVAGWLECRLLEITIIGSSAIIAGEVLHAEAVQDAWKLKLYHGGGDLFYRSGEPV